MAAVIDMDACLSCGYCESVCPGAIEMVDGSPIVYEDRCVDCGACADGCPVGAIEV